MTTSPTAIETGSFTDENMNYEYSENDLTIINTGKKVSFPYKIDMVLIYENILIVLIEPPFEIAYNRRIFGVNINGDIIWQIENVNPWNDNSPFLDITLENGKIAAWNASGHMYYVDPLTGKVLYKEFWK